MVPFLSTVTRVYFYIFGNLLITPFPTCKCTIYIRKISYSGSETQNTRFQLLPSAVPEALLSLLSDLTLHQKAVHMNNPLECCWRRVTHSFGLPGRFFTGSISRLFSTSHKTDVFQTACAEATVKPQNFYSLSPTPGYGKWKPCWMHTGICHDYSPREEWWAWKLKRKKNFISVKITSVIVDRWSWAENSLNFPHLFPSPSKTLPTNPSITINFNSKLYLWLLTQEATNPARISFNT